MTKTKQIAVADSWPIVREQLTTQFKELLESERKNNYGIPTTKKRLI